MRPLRGVSFHARPLSLAAAHSSPLSSREKYSRCRGSSDSEQKPARRDEMRASAARRSRGGENGLPASRIIFQGNAAADTAVYIAALLTISKWEVDVGRGAS